MHFRWRWRLQGAHVVIQLFSGPTELATHALFGTLTASEQEWAELRATIPDTHEVVDENAGPRC